MEEGWIKLHRCVLKHWIFDNPIYLKWWLGLLFEAKWKDTKESYCGKVYTIKRGQLIGSYRYLSELFAYRTETNSSVSSLTKPSLRTIKKFLELLKSDNMIEVSYENLPRNTSLITICNYDEYQGVDAVATTVLNTVATTVLNTDVNTVATTIKRNIKNNNNIQENKEFSLLDARARMREELRKKEESYAENLRLDTKFWEDTAIYVMASTVGWSIDDLKPMSNQFLAGIRAIADYSNNEEHFRRRFQQWLKSQVDYERRGKRAVLKSNPEKGPLDDYIREHMR